MIKLISQVIADFADGEIRQMGRIFDTDLTMKDYMDKSFYKTASLIAASCRCGPAVVSPRLYARSVELHMPSRSALGPQVDCANPTGHHFRTCHLPARMARSHMRTSCDALSAKVFHCRVDCTQAAKLLAGQRRDRSYLDARPGWCFFRRSAAVFGGVEESVKDAMFEYGRHLGLAFQVVDDILDFTQTTEQLGKPQVRGVVTMTIIELPPPPNHAAAA